MTKKIVKTTKYAYVLLIMIGDRYIPGAIVLAHQLRKLGAKQDIVVMVTSDVSEPALERLSRFVTHIVNVPYIDCDPTPDKKFYDSLNSDKKKYVDMYNSKYPRMNVFFTKWNCLKLYMYEKILFMDVDLLPVKNLDSVFTDYSAPGGVIAFPTYNSYGERKTIQSEEVVKLLDEGKHVFTAGFILLEPKKGSFTGFIKSLDGRIKENKNIIDDDEKAIPEKNCKFYGENEKKLSGSSEDEHAIVRYFKNKTWSLIPIIYYYTLWKTTKNAMFPYTEKDVAVYNYMTPIKPWEFPYDGKETYPDIELYHVAMKEIEKQNPGFILNIVPPKEVLDIDKARLEYNKNKKPTSKKERSGIQTNKKKTTGRKKKVVKKTKRRNKK